MNLLPALAWLVACGVLVRFALDAEASIERNMLLIGALWLGALVCLAIAVREARTALTAARIVPRQPQPTPTETIAPRAPRQLTPEDYTQVEAVRTALASAGLLDETAVTTQRLLERIETDGAPQQIDTYDVLHALAGLVGGGEISPQNMVFVEDTAPLDEEALTNEIMPVLSILGLAEMGPVVSAKLPSSSNTPFEIVIEVNGQSRRIVAEAFWKNLPGGLLKGLSALGAGFGKAPLAVSYIDQWYVVAAMDDPAMEALNTALPGQIARFDRPD